MDTPYIVGVRFREVGKVYHFDASQHRDLQEDDFVIVSTNHGRQIGRVVQILKTPPPPPPEGEWKPVERRATPRDLVLRQIWQQKEIEATLHCRAKATELKIAHLKIITSEFSFDGDYLVIFYGYEAKEKLDLNPLRKVLQASYPKTKVELRQIGPRDIAKLIGGMGVCGLAERCCARFLTCFNPVSIKMAKIQGISLTPEEITGMCNRLRCCMAYEYETYSEALLNMPRLKKRVMTRLGEGKVVGLNPLKGTIMVELAGGNLHEFNCSELKLDQPSPIAAPEEEEEALELEISSLITDENAVIEDETRKIELEEEGHCLAELMASQPDTNPVAAAETTSEVTAIRKAPEAAMPRQRSHKRGRERRRRFPSPPKVREAREAVEVKPSLPAPPTTGTIRPFRKRKKKRTSKKNDKSEGEAQ